MPRKQNGGVSGAAIRTTRCLVIGSLIASGCAATYHCPTPVPASINQLQPWSLEKDSLESAPVQSPGTTFRDCPECPEMVVLPSGSFIMGSPASELGRDNDEGPQRTITIPRRFAVSRYEVTRAQFAAFVRETGYTSRGHNCSYYDGQKGRITNDDPNRDWRNPGFLQEDDHPVVCVSRDDAKAYAAWLAKKTGKEYRLLSEAEWEYAARAGSSFARPWGDDPGLACQYASVRDQTFDRVTNIRSQDFHRCDDGHTYSAPVGRYQPNGFGLYDMIGNVWEWVEDWWHDSYTQAPLDSKPWLTGDTACPVIRGGGWSARPHEARSARRDMMFTTGDRDSRVGFRLARTF